MGRGRSPLAGAWRVAQMCMRAGQVRAPGGLSTLHSGIDSLVPAGPRVGRQHPFIPRRAESYLRILFGSGCRVCAVASTVHAPCVSEAVCAVRGGRARAGG